MLERFHVPEDIAVRVPQETMRATTEAIFQAMGMPEADARQGGPTSSCTPTCAASSRTACRT